MNKNEFPNIDIDELLNSYIDGELDARHQTEVQRLIEHDQQVAKRLQKIRNCRQLVSSLPYAEAPQGTLENIKAAIEKTRPPLPRTRHRHFDRQKGAKHLLVRQLLAAAAMIGLVAVLGAVIYSILAPQPPIDKPFVFETYQPQLQPAPESAIAADKPAFTGQLLLETKTPSEVVAFINTAIERNTISATFDGPGQSQTVFCSRQNFSSFMADLGGIWDKVDKATLIVETDRPEQQIAVAAVVPDQIVEIANQDEIETQIKAAQYFAALNTKPAEDSMLAEDTAPTTIPKPVLTSGANRPEMNIEKQVKTERKVVLTIVVTDSEI